MQTKRRYRATGPVTALLAAWAFMTGAPASAQLDEVPEAWLSYAQLAGGQFQGWLDGNSRAANVLHAYLEDRAENATADTPRPEIVVRAWIDPTGAVTHVEFDTLGQPVADAALRHLLTGFGPLTAPPRDMLQPLRLRLTLLPNRNAGNDAEKRSP
jgi:hypothetical protein